MRALRFLHVLFAACFTVGVVKSNAGTLIDVAFTSASATEKKGFAATGVTANDFWNTCNGSVPNLEFVDGTASGAGLTAGADFTGTNGASDPMYGFYVSSCYLCSFTVTVNDLI